MSVIDVLYEVLSYTVSVASFLSFATSKISSRKDLMSSDCQLSNLLILTVI